MGRPDDPASVGFLWQLFLIFAASAFAPLQVWVNNPESPAFATSAAVILVVTALGLGVRAVLVRLGADPLGITYSIAIFIVFIFNTGKLVDPVPGGRWTMMIVALVVAGMAYRLRGMGLFRGLMTWGALLLLILPAVTYFTRGDPGVATIEANLDLSVPSFESRPDVVVIVLDGYASEEVLQEFHHFDNAEFDSDMEALGFSVGEGVKSNFPLTLLSVANTLNLNYLVDEQHLVRADIDGLYEILGGNNTLARVLDDNGYSQTYVESGWLGTRCRSLVDECVPGLWPDETIYDIALRSLFLGLPGLEEGRSFSRGALRNIHWLEENLGHYLRNDVSDYIYVHVLAPHPPFFLTSSCDSAPTAKMSGFTTGGPSYSQEEIEARSKGYQEQVRCLNQVLSSVATAAVANDAVVVMFGDHGSDRGGQLSMDGSEWTDADIRERFGVFFAGYGPGCDFEDIGSLVNVSRRIVSCLSDEEFVDLPSRTFLPSKSWDMTEFTSS